MKYFLAKAAFWVAMLSATIPAITIARVTRQELYDILKRDGISNSLEPETKIHSIGKMLLKGRWYSFFYYDHVTRETQHGLYRILILDDRKRFIGGFEVVDGTDCKIREIKVICFDDKRVYYAMLDFREKYLIDIVTNRGSDDNFWK
jgi:hypothetical protein